VQFTDDEHEFMQACEVALLRCLIASNGVCEATIDVERRLVIEAALFLKLLILIARDGLKMANGRLLAATLLELWDDDDIEVPMLN
jgi:hypothetical protein